MADRLLIIAGFGGMMAVLYVLCMRSAPRKGFSRVLETLCAGVILCYLCQLCAGPFGIHVPQGPVSAAFAGALGLPGAALATLLHMLF